MFIVLNIPIISELEFDIAVLATKVEYKLCFFHVVRLHKMAGV